MLYEANSLIMAPLSGYTDLPYRNSLRRHGCRYAFTEMIDTGAIVHASKSCVRFFDKGKDEDWLGVQLVGCNLEEFKYSIEYLKKFNFSAVDINMGCPMRKVAGKGKGAGLAKDSDKAAAIVELLVTSLNIPVSAKIRIQSEVDPESTIYLAQKIKNAGASALTIHGRIAEKIYSGKCYGDIISAVRESLKIQVIANGGVSNKATYEELRQMSGCSEIMVARGAMGNPWLFDVLQGFKKYPPTKDELCNEIEIHFMDLLEYAGDNIAFKLSRKIILDYIKGRGFSADIRISASKISSRYDFINLIERLRSFPDEKYVHHSL